jgi:hypothetical protein
VKINLHEEILKTMPPGFKVGADGKLILPNVRPATPSAESQPMRGLGDVVAAVAQPIARAIDRVAKKNFQNCGGCKARQEKLNKIAPL